MEGIKRGLVAQAGAYVDAATASQDKFNAITSSDQVFARAAPDSDTKGEQAAARLTCGSLNECDTEMPQTFDSPYQQLSASAASPQQQAAAAVPEPTAAKPKATRHKATCSKKVCPPAAAVQPRTSKHNKKPAATSSQPLEQAGSVAKAAHSTLDPDSLKQPAATRGRKAPAGPSRSPSKKAKIAGDKAAAKPPANKRRKLDSAPTADIPPVPQASEVYEYAPGVPTLTLLALGCDQFDKLASVAGLTPHLVLSTGGPGVNQAFADVQQTFGMNDNEGLTLASLPLHHVQLAYHYLRSVQLHTTPLAEITNRK